MGSFHRGFRNRSPLVLLVAAALLVPTLFAIQAAFTSGLWTNVPVGYWLRNRTDSFTYVSWIVGDVRRRDPEGTEVYLLGGSSAREALVSGDGLAAEIEDLGGPRTEAYDLGCINQNFAESLAVADEVPRDGAWVLIGVNLGRFTATRQTNAQQAEGRDLLVGSDVVQDFVSDEWGLQKYTFTIAPGIFAYATDYLKRTSRELGGDELPRTYRQHRYTESKIWSDRRKREMVDFWNEKRYPVFRANVTTNLEVLEETLRVCRERGVHAVVVELPLNLDIVGDSFDKAIAEYRAPARALAAENGAAYLDFNEELDIPSSSFRDLSHLVEPGRVVWQQALAKALAGLMRNGSEGGSG